MWKHVYASVVGTSHLEAGTPCQDQAVCECVPSTKGDVLVALCSDGAGSANYADVGATLATQVMLNEIKTAINRNTLVEEISRDTVLAWLRRARVELADAAEITGCRLREYSATFLGAILGESSSAFFQIGDGAIVSGTSTGYSPVFWPRNCEYINATHFITDDNFAENLQFEVQINRIDEAALLTDGLERLALQMTDRVAHAPFFAPMFRSLRKAESGKSLQLPMRTFLDSSAVNERTDDDKTLILATRIPPSDEPALPS